MRSRTDRREVPGISPRNAATIVPASSDRLSRQPTRVVRVVTPLVLIAPAVSAASLTFLPNKNSSPPCFFFFFFTFFLHSSVPIHHSLKIRYSTLLSRELSRSQITKLFYDRLYFCSSSDFTIQDTRSVVVENK